MGDGTGSCGLLESFESVHKKSYEGSSCERGPNGVRIRNVTNLRVKARSAQDHPVFRMRNNHMNEVEIWIKCTDLKGHQDETGEGRSSC